MKKFFLLAVLGVLCFESMAQKTKTPAKPSPKPTKQVLKNAYDSFSYAVGMSIALQYKEFGVKNLNTTAVITGVNDVLKNTNVALTPDQANFILNNYINKLMAEKAIVNKKAGETFLATNKTKPGIKTLPSGMQYMVIKEGTGAMPAITDTVTVHYTGTLIDGTIFDSSVDRGEPAQFTVGGVIKGWTDALQLMKAGSRWKLFIPAEMAYGNYSPPGSNIPPGSLLIFDVELLSVGGK